VSRANTHSHDGSIDRKLIALSGYRRASIMPPIIGGANILPSRVFAQGVLVLGPETGTRVEQSKRCRAYFGL